MKFRITKIAAYLYHRRGTLSFCWMYRMPWKPEWHRDSSGWFVGFWRFGLEWMAFDEWDPWGEQQFENMTDVWNMLAKDISDEDHDHFD